MVGKIAQVLQNRQVRERSILRNVYLWMTGGLGLTSVLAFGISSNREIVQSLASQPILFFGLIIAELAIVILLSARIQKMSPAAAMLGFTVYAALNGVTLSVILLAYTGTSIALAFLVSAGMFAGMSVYALTTKRDLSGFGHFFMMGLWGIIIASILNLFLKSEMLYWLLSYAGVALFLGLTAYDTQRIQSWNKTAGDSMSEEQYIRLSILGALKLYLDFINLFLFFLRIFGRRR